MFSSLDVTTAECQFPTDKAMILRAVEQQHGSAYAFNTKLKLQLLLEPLSYRCGVCCSMCQAGPPPAGLSGFGCRPVAASGTRLPG